MTNEQDDRVRAAKIAVIEAMEYYHGNRDAAERAPVIYDLLQALHASFLPWRAACLSVGIDPDGLNAGRETTSRLRNALGRLRGAAP